MNETTATPLFWDRLFALGTQEELAAIAWENPNRQAIAQMRGMSGDELRSVVQAAMVSDRPLARAAALLGLTQLAAWQQVLQVGGTVTARSGSMEDVEDASISAFCVATAAVQLGDSVRGLGMLAVAEAFAAMAGMIYRQQHIALEYQRLQLSLGNADPERIQAVMHMAPMSEMRTTWATSLLSTAYLSLGMYSACAALEAPSSVLARAILAPAAPPERATQGPHKADILALHEYRRGRGDISCAGGAYNQLMRVAFALRAGQVTMASELLHFAPVSPDERLLWGLLMLETEFKGGRIPMRPLEAHAVIVSASEKLRAHDEVLKFALELCPLAVAALQFTPLISGELRAAARQQAILLGEHVLLLDEMHKLPGKRNGGEALLFIAMGDNRKLSRVERLRLKRTIEAICGPSHLVSIVEVLHLLTRWSRLAPEAEQDLWNTAVTNLFNMASGKLLKRSLSTIISTAI